MHYCRRVEARSTQWYLPTAIFSGFVARLNRVAAPLGLHFVAHRPDECSRLASELVLRAHPDKGGDGRSVDEAATIRREWREALRSEARRLADGQLVQLEPQPAPAQAAPAPQTASRPARDIGWIASHDYSAKLVRCGYPGCCGRAERPGAFFEFRKLFDKRVAFPMACALLARLSSISRHSDARSD